MKTARVKKIVGNLLTKWSVTDEDKIEFLKELESKFAEPGDADEEDLEPITEETETEEVEEENPTEEVIRIVNTFPVLDAAVAWMEQFKQTLKQNGQDVSKLDAYNIIDISGALQMRLEQLVADSLED